MEICSVLLNEEGHLKQLHQAQMLEGGENTVGTAGARRCLSGLQVIIIFTLYLLLFDQLVIAQSKM